MSVRSIWYQMQGRPQSCANPATRVVLPQPALAVTMVAGKSTMLRIRCIRRGLGITWRLRRGGSNFVLKNNCGSTDFGLQADLYLEPIPKPDYPERVILKRHVGCRFWDGSRGWNQ